MQDEVGQAIYRGIVERREILRALTLQQRIRLLEDMFVELFGHQHVTLQKWGALTGQSAQVDTGYIAQFVASIVLGQPGQGYRGKGDDLADGSEVKGAANISGVDRPRWNHNLGSLADDAKRRHEGKVTTGEAYLAIPHMFYLLVDRPVGVESPVPLRIRAWCIDAQADQAWRSLFETFLRGRVGRTYNFQLHPPVGYDDHIVVNTLGNLDFSEVLVFDARLDLSDRANPTVSWATPLAAQIVPIAGRTRALPYGGRTARPTRYTEVDEIVLGTGALRSLFVGILDSDSAERIEDVTEAEVVATVQADENVGPSS